MWRVVGAVIVEPLPHVEDVQDDVALGGVPDEVIRNRETVTRERESITA